MARKLLKRDSVLAGRDLDSLCDPPGLLGANDGRAESDEGAAVLLPL
jgi:hypothetical protein